MSVEPVVVTIEVSGGIERVFAFYTQKIASWWPLASHAVSREKAVSCAIEGRAGAVRGSYEAGWTGILNSDLADGLATAEV